ncbi:MULTISPECIES: DUF6779 domain-containing protein [unclassified Amycolatopsis]|uniref:DUF6779 domain-containing protein n=1 Tax=unclassified Amycolatopsis TaxID=2618356 RepID=UPI002875F18E|nr:MULTISPECIES: DUF6779 domain-containing protein [unclassified Amycolatopsis]MDS0133667.1 hypothetical protein [Amycolatopsis sp. 505]MDS0148488.1 hypothetical protein [Amycolatopsis sp. CM201R]
MTGVGDDSRGRLLGRPWLVVGFVLAIGATLALVLSDDLRYLRLGIVAALWAALIGAFLAVKYRKSAAQSEDAVAEAQAVYELELEREIAARREYELEMEAENRSAADSKGREELEALRAEVSALRDSLQSLFGGEVLLERVALTAQATRMRKLSDENRLIPDAAPKKKPAQLMAGKKPVVEGGERPTELIDRVLDERRRKASNGKPANGKGLGKGKGFGGKPVPKAPANVSVQSTQQMARPKPLSERRPPVPPVDPALNAAQRELKAAELRAEAARRQAESQPMRLPKQDEVAKQPERRPEAAAEPTRRDVPRPPADPKTEIRRPQAPEPKTEIRRPQPPEPKTEIRRPEPPPARRAELSRSDIRPVEVSRPDIPRVEMSRPDLPRVEAPMPRPEAPRPNAPRAEASRADIPRVEMSRPDIPRVEMSRPDIPRVEMSRPDIPRVDMSRADIPRAEMSRPDIPRVEMSRPDIPRVEMSRPDIPRVEMSRPDLPRVGGQPNGARPDPRKAPEPPRPAPGRPAASVPPPKPSEMSRSDIRPVKDLSAAFQNRDDFAERQRPNRPKPPEPKPPMPRDAAASRTDLPPVVPPTTPVPSNKPAPRQPSRTDLPPVVPPTTPVPAADSRRPSRLEQFSRADMSPILEEPPSRHGGSHRAPAAEAAKAESPMANPTLPESVRNFQGRSGGRRRKPEDSQQMPAVPAAAPEPPGGGRRRRPDGEPPAWEGMVAERASMSRRGMAPVDPADVEQPQNGNGHNGARNGRRAAPEPAPGSGSHAAGRSVSELLAANGGTGATPRRRRRAED